MEGMRLQLFYSYMENDKKGKMIKIENPDVYIKPRSMTPYQLHYPKGIKK